MNIYDLYNFNFLMNVFVSFPFKKVYFFEWLVEKEETIIYHKA